MKSHGGDQLACYSYNYCVAEQNPYPGSPISVCPHQSRYAFVCIPRLQSNMSSQERPEGVNLTWFGTQRIQNNSQAYQGSGPTSLPLTSKAWHQYFVTHWKPWRHHDFYSTGQELGNGDLAPLMTLGELWTSVFSQIKWEHEQQHFWNGQMRSCIKAPTQYLPCLTLPINYDIIGGMMLEGKYTENCILPSTQNSSPGQEVNELRSNYLWCTG